MEGLSWETLQLSLGAGLMQRADDRARQPPYLDIANDIEFDEPGGIRLRKPYAQIESDDTLSNARRTYRYNDELLVFTDDELMTFSQASEAFISRATYLAVKPTEVPRYIQTGDQAFCDRAVLNGSVVHVWEEGGACYVAISDEDTGSVIVAPTSFTATRPRVVACTTGVIIFYVNGGGDLIGGSVNLTTGAITVLVTVIAAAAFSVYYDVTRLIGTDSVAYVARRVTTTSYTVGTLTVAGVHTTTNKARDCTGPIAVASHPLGTHVMVVRTNVLNLVGDYLSIAGPFTDVAFSTAIGSAATTMDALTCAFRSTTNGGQYRCYVFWASDYGLTGDQVEYSYVDTAAAVGAEATLARRVHLASRAFDHNGRVFVNVAFTEASSFTGASYTSQLQSTIFLFRDDAHRCGKHLQSRAAIPATYASASLLPGVANVGTNTYSWCATERRIISVAATQSTHADRGPCDITIEFDSNEARRVAQIGRTLYVSGAEVMQYDGARLVEVGFPIYPWSFALAEAASGSIADNALFATKVTWRYDNAQGERERSTTATTGEITIAAQPAGITYTILPLHVTHKTSPAVAVEVWRTQKAPLADSPFFLSTNIDSGDTSGSNCFVTNAPTSASISYTDELADAAIADMEAHPENGGTLPPLAPPGATLIVANDQRVFLGGVSGDPHRIWYSMLRQEGQIAAFSPALVVDIPRVGGAITALAFLGGTLIVFRETAIYALEGSGFENFIGVGANYGPARTLSTDCGAVSQEAVAETADGIIFKSSKGWYLLNRGGGVEYIGSPISDHDDEDVYAVTVLTGQHQIRVLTEDRILVLDTVAKQWGAWTVADGVHAVMWQGQHCYLTTSQVMKQDDGFTTVQYSLDVETAWIKPADLQGWARIRRILVLGEYRSAHDLRIRIAYDYDETYVDDVTWTVSPTTVGGPEQVKVGPSRQQCQAFKVRITSQAVGVASVSTGEALKLTGLGVELGYRRGLHRRIPAAQKAGA